ncbi:MAG: metallophosphoesterase family protein [Solirubrobacteraceae bacterium]|nr:metallophosphoesterase family protein [Solirubrobacteraceae bacterium]
MRHRLRAPLLTLAVTAATAVTAAPAVALDPTPSAVPDRIVLAATERADTTQAVTWRTDAGVGAGRAQIARADGGPTTTVDATSDLLPVRFAGWSYGSRHHTATFTGLAPDTTYRYRVGDDGRWSGWRTLRTAPAPDDARPWTFLYFGDAQNEILAKWPPVVRRAFATAPDARLMLHAGDLVNNADRDDQWSEWFATLEGHVDRIPTITTAGNHEYSGDRLIRQYRAHFPVAATAGPMTAFRVDHGGVRFVSMNANDKAPWLTGQTAFLRDQLRDNPHRWSVVTFHQPVLSNSGDRDNPEVRDAFLPVLREQGADLVLQGHDHTYGRGFVNADRGDDPGVSTGPVFVTSNSGPKHYELSDPADNSWTRNGATRVVGFGRTSTFQTVRVERDRLVYRSYAGARADGATAPGGVGDVVDAFTVTKGADGRRRVTEGVPADVPAEPAADRDGAPTGAGATGGTGSTTAAGSGATAARGRVTWRSVRAVRRTGALRVRLRVPAKGRLTVRATSRGGRSFTATRTVRRTFRGRATSTVTLRPSVRARRTLRDRRRLAVRVTARFRAADGRTTTVRRSVTMRRR